MNKGKEIILLFIGLLFSGLNISWAQDNQVVQAGEILKKIDVGIDVSKLNYLNPAEKEKLAKNGFVIFIPDQSTDYPEDEAIGVYNKCKNSHFPVFLSSDVVLHVSHLLFDWSLRFLEISSLRQDLLNLTDALLSQSLAYYDQIEQKDLKNAAYKNALFFNVAKTLLAGGNLNELPEDVKQIIEKETILIDKHSGFAVSPLFGREEDYSQYVPRGHYTRSPEFEKYFKALMWYGRMDFRLETKSSETLQAVLICKAITETKVKGEDALVVWERIYETTSFFAGRADDLTVKDYTGLIEKVYGENPTLNSMADQKKIEEFIKEARQLRKPKILSTYITDVSSREVDWRIQTQAFRLMGQRFAIDSYILQNLVYDKVKQYLGKDPKPFTAVFANGVWLRGFPRGLDIMAVFDSQVAEEILKAEGDTDFQGYQQQFLILKDEYSKIEEGIWKQDLYGLRLRALKSILGEPSQNVPFFMQTKAWLKKQLNTSLGSWTELKHDTILYTKQPYSMAQMAMAGKGGWERYLPAEVVHGYVEPVPEFYSCVKEPVEQLRLKLTSLGFPKDIALGNNLQWFENFLANLEIISKKELTGTTLSDDEYALIEDVGNRLSRFLSFAHYTDVTAEFRDEMDNKMPLVADVFTEVNSQQVLEEAIGHPAEIFVIAPVDGKNKVCLGVVYSHYEFKQPMHDRLTDEAWRDMLKKNKFPAVAKWLNDIVVIQDENTR